MTKRPSLPVWLASGLLALALLTGTYGWYGWQQFKQEQGIVELDWEGLRLSTKGFSVQRLNVRRDDPGQGQLSLHVRDASLSFRQLFPEFNLGYVEIRDLGLVFKPAATQLYHDEDSFSWPDQEQLARWLRWMPSGLDIGSLSLTLPCATKIACQEHATLHWRYPDDNDSTATLAIGLERAPHQLKLTATARQAGPDIHFNLQLGIDEQERLSLQSQLEPLPQRTRWSGALAMNSLPEAPWLLDWLAEWIPYEPVPLPELPEQMRLGAGWALDFPASSEAPLDWRTLAGELRLSADLPAFWPIVGLGQLKGQLDMAARGQAGHWLPTELRADLTLLPEASRLENLPSELRPQSLTLKAASGASSASRPDMLPLELTLDSKGPANATLQSQLLLSTTLPLTVTVEQARFRLPGTRLTLADVALSALSADLRLDGQADQQTARLHLRKGSSIAIGTLSSGPDITVERLQLDMGDVQLDAEYPSGALGQLRAKGPVALNAGRVLQASLKPQGWRWSGQLDADENRLALAGPLRNDAGMELAINVQKPWNGALRLEARLPEIFFRAGNPLAATLSDWPALLDINNGRFQAQGQLSLPASGGPLTGKIEAQANGLGGILDRTELTGLDARASLNLRRNSLSLDVAQLSLQQANPGLTFGPILLRGDYEAPRDAPMQGRLSWKMAEAHILGGKFWLDTASSDLSAPRQNVTARLQGLDLAQLLAAYPTQGLTGSGVIDGEFEFQRNARKISVEKGTLAARVPGGALQFRSAQIQALGASNQAMRIVTEALDDFHYDLLTSDVRYDENGKLKLGLRLHGRNPALEGGRPINFSINLEEDIPALLTSLQLSDRVSETIQRRVQEHLK